MNLTGIPRSTSNNTAQSDGLLQKAHGHIKHDDLTESVEENCAELVLCSEINTNFFQKFYESVVKVHENLHLKDIFI